jgi:hypothetical protein
MVAQALFFWFGWIRWVLFVGARGPPGLQWWRQALRLSAKPTYVDREIQYTP